LRVLVVDDDSVSRTILKNTLSWAGYDVICCKSGQEAREVLEASEPPRLLLMDLLMPEMDGLTLCKLVRANDTAQLSYVIMVTVLDKKEIIIRALRAGANDFITKPFDPDELIARVSVARKVIEVNALLIEQNQKLEKSLNDLDSANATLHHKNLELEAVNKALDAFAFTVSDDMKSPLCGIRGYLKSLKKVVTTTSDADSEKMIRAIEGEVERMAQLIRDIISLAKTQSHSISARSM
jgi:DNA-binding response OmpR family regulator